MGPMGRYLSLKYLWPCIVRQVIIISLGKLKAQFFHPFFTMEPMFLWDCTPIISQTIFLFRKIFWAIVRIQAGNNDFSTKIDSSILSLPSSQCNGAKSLWSFIQSYLPNQSPSDKVLWWAFLWHRIWGLDKLNSSEFMNFMNSFYFE